MHQGPLLHSHSSGWQAGRQARAQWGAWGVADLHAEHVLTGVPFQQGPLRGLALQQVGCQGHLPAGDICSQPFAYPSAARARLLVQLADVLAVIFWCMMAQVQMAHCSGQNPKAILRYCTGMKAEAAG